MTAGNKRLEFRGEAGTRNMAVEVEGIKKIWKPKGFGKIFLKI